MTRTHIVTSHELPILSGSGTLVSYNTVKGTLLQVLKAARLDGISSQRKLRIHDLRHIMRPVYG